MTNIEALRQVLIKYKLFHPVPEDVQRAVSDAKREKLKELLSHYRDYTLHVRMALSLLYVMKGAGAGITFRTARRVVTSGYAVAACAVAAFTIFLAKPYIIQQEPWDRGFVIAAVGDVQVQREALAPAVLAVQDGIFKGDRIITGDKSFVVIQAGPEKLVRIQEKSEVTADEVMGIGAVQFGLKEGRILAKLGKLGKGQSFTVKTPTTIAAVRGTVFGVTQKGGDCVISVVEGTVQVLHIAAKMKKSLDTGKTAVLTGSLDIRAVDEMERLELDRIKAIPFPKDEKYSPGELESLHDIIMKNDKKIDEAAAKLAGDMIPRTLDEIRQKYGRVDVVYLYNGQTYSGAILSRGQQWKVLVPGRYVYVNATAVRTTGVR